MHSDSTLDYYNKNADIYAADTLGVAFHDLQDRFLNYLDSGSLILDFGCGAGRDSKYFTEKGFKVEAIDGSEELVNIARKETGLPVRRMFFEELNEIDRYDAVWACSSILHLNRDELKDVFAKMLKAVKPGGYIYTSFKYGEFEGFRGERYFIDFKEESFKCFLKDFPDAMIEMQWVSGDVRPGREKEMWLNLILKKVQRR